MGAARRGFLAREGLAMRAGLYARVSTHDQQTLGLQSEAMRELEQAAKLLPDNAEVNYNLGLIYFDRKDYQTSQSYAKRAYAGGFPLPGLRRKLAAAGYPLD